MDEFIAFLIIGLVFIAVAFFALGPFSPYSETFVVNKTSGQTTTTLPSTEIPKTEGKFLIGPESIEVWRSIDLGKINVSYGNQENKITVERKKLFNGLLFGSNKLEIKAPVDTKNFVGAKLSFYVEKTNQYAPLMIKFNHHLLNKSIFSEGFYEFIINSSWVTEDNWIDFIPLSSSWKIWAPSVYELKDITFSFQTLYSLPTIKKFIVYDREYKNLANRYGKIILDLNEHKGVLKIDINGINVFSNSTKTYNQIYFDQSYLDSGENEIDFYSEENSKFSGNARILIYYYTTRENKLERTFSLSEDDYEKLKTTKGKIEFNITDIINPGGLSVTIEDSNGLVHNLGYRTVENGMYYFYFNQSDCRPGYNKVILRSVDNSTFWVNGFKIMV